MLLVVMLLQSCMALAVGIGTSPLPEPPVSEPWYMQIISDYITGLPEFNTWLVVIFGFGSAMLRGLSEFLLFIHKKTETQFDDTALAWINSLLKWMASISAWFGVGIPKDLKK